MTYPSLFFVGNILSTTLQANKIQGTNFLSRNSETVGLVSYENEKKRDREGGVRRYRDYQQLEGLVFFGR